MFCEICGQLLTVQEEDGPEKGNLPVVAATELPAEAEPSTKETESSKPAEAASPAGEADVEVERTSSLFAAFFYKMRILIDGQVPCKETPRKRRQDPFQGGTGDSRDSREDDIIGRFQPSVVVPGEKRRVQTVPGREDVWELFHVHGVVDVQVHFLWRENLEGGRLLKPCDSSRLLCGGGRRQSSGMRG